MSEILSKVKISRDNGYDQSMTSYMLDPFHTFVDLIWGCLPVVKIGRVMPLELLKRPHSYIPSPWKPYPFIYSKYEIYAHFIIQIMVTHSYINLILY